MLVLTMVLMAAASTLIGLLPTYAEIGIAAPILLVLLRAIQGFSVGGEYGGAALMAVESAPPGERALRGSVVQNGAYLGLLLANGVFLLFSQLLSNEAFQAWGWRIPLLLGCAIIPFLFILRRSLAETDEFSARKHKPSVPEIFRSLSANWSIILIGMMMVTMTTVSFYMITAYTPTFANSVLHLAAIDGLIVTLCIGASNLFWLPVMGSLSDRVGRRPLLLACTALMLLTAYPSMLWLIRGPSFSRLLIVELWLSFLYGSYNGAMVVFLTEIMPVSVRTSGFALAYSLATAVFGGFTPALSTYLIHLTGNRAIPGLWLSVAGACGLVGALVGRPDTDSNPSALNQVRL